MRQMKAAVWDGGAQVRLVQKEVPVIEHPHEAIVKVSMAAICSSDLHILHGAVPEAKRGVTLGHEMVGTIVQCGSAVKRFAPGERVSVNVETSCGSCFYCRNGFVNNCSDPLGGWSLGRRIDGGQAEYVRVPYAEQGLNRIPEGVSDEAALFTGDLLSTGYWAAQISQIEAGQHVAVIGAGPAGLCTLMCLRLQPEIKLILIDIDQERLAFARRLGLADVFLDPSQDDAAAKVRALTEGRGADRVLEIAGGADTFQLAWQIARPNAIVSVIAMYEQDQLLPLPQMYGKNLTFKTGGVDGVWCDEILRLIAQGKIDAKPLITHRFSIDEIAEAYRLFEQREDHVMKVAVTF